MIKFNQEKYDEAKSKLRSMSFAGLRCEEPIVVKIVRCESGDWYKDMIGQEVIVGMFGTFGFKTPEGKHVCSYDVEFNKNDNLLISRSTRK